MEHEHTKTFRETFLNWESMEDEAPRNPLISAMVRNLEARRAMEAQAELEASNKEKDLLDLHNEEEKHKDDNYDN